MHPLMFVIRLSTAVAGGALIGLEREWNQHRAGLRTNVLVAVGAALFVMIGVLTPDPATTRMASYVVSGVGFLGAGAMIRDGLTVRGLNTAATLWCAAAVGSLAGFGYFWGAGIASATVLGTNAILRPIVQRFSRRAPTADEPVTYTVRARCRRTRETQVRSLLLHEINGSQLLLQALHTMTTPIPSVLEVHAHVVATGPADVALERVVARLSVERDVSEVSWAVGANDLVPLSQSEAAGGASRDI